MKSLFKKLLSTNKKWSICIVFCVLLTLNSKAQRLTNTKFFIILDNTLSRLYFGNMSDLMVYHYETMNYVLSDKNEKRLYSGLIKTSIKINSLTRLVIQNEYLVELGKMEKYLNAPQIGIRKYF